MIIGKISFFGADLKDRRAIDDSFKKKGEKFVSERYEIKIVEFERVFVNLQKMQKGA